MRRSFSLFVAGAVLAHPVSAVDNDAKAERDRQMSEIVFQNYPPRALANGEQGAVFFVVSLDNDAHATSCEVTHGSGHPLLDEETCYLIVQHAVFKSARDANGRVVKQTAEGVVNWTIPGREPVPLNPILLSGKAKPEKQVCKKTLRIGTLSEVEQTCMTRSEWVKQSERSKQPWLEITQKGYTVCPTDPDKGPMC